VDYDVKKKGYLEPSAYEAKARKYAQAIYKDFRNRDFSTDSVQVSSYAGPYLEKRMARVGMIRRDAYIPMMHPSSPHVTRIDIELSLSGRLLKFTYEQHEGIEGSSEDLFIMTRQNEL
jgi:hypothetical protein